MLTKQEKHMFLSDREEVLNRTKELTGKMRATADYQMYEKNLQELKKHKETYQKLNEFRLKNMLLDESAEDYNEKADALYEEYNNILMETAVRNFLTAEQRVCKMMKRVYDCIAQEMQLDVSYMD